jgi:glycine cleavage system aminomethyltransferase T
MSITADVEVLAAIGPRVRKSPFWDDTVQAGLSAVSSYNHMWLPMSYGDADEEYRLLTEAVTIWDVAAQRHVAVRGPDADSIVQYVTAIDASKIDVGIAAYAPMVDHHGVLINDPILFHVDVDEWHFSIADADIRLWIDAIARERGADCSVTELDTVTLALQGPLAEAVMSDLGVDVDGMNDLEQRSATIDGLDVMVSRSGWSTQGGYEIFLDDPRHASRLWTAVASAGQAHGIGPAAPNPSERIENVLLSYGTDTGYHANPLELGLGDTIDLDHDDFVGRDALRRMRDAGPERRLLGVVIDGPRRDMLPHPVPISSGAATLGELRAAAWSPRFAVNLGLALVDRDVEPGSTGRAEPPSGACQLTFVELPFEEPLPGHDR